MCRCVRLEPQYGVVLNRNARADLLVLAVGLTVQELAADCVSHVSLGVAPDTSAVVQWHTDVPGPSDLPRVWLSIESALDDPRGIEVLAEEIAGPEVRRHLLEYHRRRT